MVNQQQIATISNAAFPLDPPGGEADKGKTIDLQEIVSHTCSANDHLQEIRADISCKDVMRLSILASIPRRTTVGHRFPLY
jgi:hypothetical protein